MTLFDQVFKCLGIGRDEIIFQKLFFQLGKKRQCNSTDTLTIMGQYSCVILIGENHLSPRYQINSLKATKN